MTHRSHDIHLVKQHCHVTIVQLYFLRTDSSFNMVQNWITPAYEAILEKYKEDYDSAYGKKQHDLVKVIKQALRETQVVENIEGKFPKSLTLVNNSVHYLHIYNTEEVENQAIKRYYGDGIETKKKASETKYIRNWTVRRVVNERCRESILEKVGARPGSEDHMKRHQKVLSKVVDGLSEKEWKDYQEMADNWNNKGSPPEVQKR